MSKTPCTFFFLSAEERKPQRYILISKQIKWNVRNTREMTNSCMLRATQWNIIMLSIVILKLKGISWSHNSGNKGENVTSFALNEVSF